MTAELETAFGISIDEDKHVRRPSHSNPFFSQCRLQTLMTVVQELDKTLFGSYVKPKAASLTGIVRTGILDPEMDWYETPQPKGRFGSEHRIQSLTIYV